MNKQSESLLMQAQNFCGELATHKVLSQYWDQVSLVLKGSVARGNADRYSDIDFVFFAADEICNKIVMDFHDNGLTERTDGIFMPLPDWIGHYHVEAYSKLEKYFSGKNFPQIWEYSNTIVMHDPHHRFSRIVEFHQKNLLNDALPFVKNKYIELQLTLDWLRHPLKRGEKIAVLFHCSKIVNIICQLSYLCDERPYPHDKWLFSYIDTTGFGKIHKQTILEYAGTILSEEDIPRNKEFDEYDQYKTAAYLVERISHYIKGKYGDHRWIDEWYLFA